MAARLLFTSRRRGFARPGNGDASELRNPERELSLIPFPMEEIFDTKLHTFDVVVFQNFGYAEPALSIASYERNLEQYVSAGGALLVIGGLIFFIRFTYPRFREDQLQRFAWTVLIPLSLVNILATAILKVVF